jgi:predicted O-linked N-acetylglucosamine transferase (SPINDLY family)
MGSSLIKSCGLDELVTENIDDYIAVAVKLGTSSAEYDLIKNTLEKNLQTTPLFNAPRTVKLIESGHQEAMKIYLCGEKPRHIEVQSI